MRAAWICGAFPVIFIGQTAAQIADPPLVLRSETRAVEISVIARDKTGEPIGNLRSQDFTIFDNGQPRRVQLFSMAADPAPSGKPAERRETAIVLDALNTEFSDQSYARDQAIKALERMPLDESIAIVELTPALKLQNFTHDRALLLAAIQSFEPMAPPYAMKQRIQVTLAALKTLSERMSKSPGRKSIVWITGGFPSVTAYDGAIKAVLQQINQADVSIYPVDARGLMLRHGNNFQAMDQFAESTGGRAYYNGNDVAGSIEDAAADSRSAYTIGFYLNGGEHDRRFHTLRVEVDRPGASLRYRRGYSPSNTARN
jgi:VWFA-related protein